MNRDDIRTYLARIFLGKARVRSLRPEGRDVVLHTVARVVATRPLRSPERVLGSALYGTGMDVSAKGFRMPKGVAGELRKRVRGGVFSFEKDLSVKGRRVIRDKKISSHSVSRFSVRCLKGLDRISPLPLDVRNRLPWFRGRTSFLKTGESLLALYCPVLEDGLLKSVLNKERGTLLVWYNPRRAWKARGLLLVRNFSPGSGLEWRWIDVQ